jgi:hypothetical protein
MVSGCPITATNNAGADHENGAADLGLRLTSTKSCPDTTTTCR